VPISGPELPVLGLSALSGFALVPFGFRGASVDSPAPGPVVESGAVLPGVFTLCASLAGRSVLQPKLTMPPNKTSTSALVCMRSSSIDRSLVRERFSEGFVQRACQRGLLVESANFLRDAVRPGSLCRSATSNRDAFFFWFACCDALRRGRLRLVARSRIEHFAYVALAKSSAE
jgi:hypothetical protein